MPIATTTLGRTLAVGDAVIFLGEPRVITAIERVGRTAERELRAGPDICFRVGMDQEVSVEKLTPGPHDGYMSAVATGWHVVSEGADFGIFVDESVAATTLAATSKRPRWKVSASGQVTRLA